MVLNSLLLHVLITHNNAFHDDTVIWVYARYFDYIHPTLLPFLVSSTPTDTSLPSGSSPLSMPVNQNEGHLNKPEGDRVWVEKAAPRSHGVDLHRQ